MQFLKTYKRPILVGLVLILWFLVLSPLLYGLASDAGVAGLGAWLPDPALAVFMLPAPGDSFPTRVAVQQPNGETMEEKECTVNFRVIPTDRYNELLREGDSALLLELIADWDGVQTHDGESLACTPDAIQAAAQIPYFALAVADAYKSRFSPAKNLRALLGT